MIGRSFRVPTMALTLVLVAHVSRCQRGAAPGVPDSGSGQGGGGRSGRTYEGPATLYAQRATELHAGTANGPVIGRIFRGGPVVAAASPDATGQLSFVLPGFTNGIVPDSGVSSAIVAFAPAVAFDSQSVTLERPEPVGRMVEDFPPGVEVASAPGAEPFAVTRCDDVHVLEVREQSSRISQYHAGVEISGWISAPIDVSRGPIRCKLREIYRRGPKLIARDGISAVDETELSAVPPEYVHADDQEVLFDLVDKGKTVFWLTRTKTMEARCSAWRFHRRERSRGATATDEARGSLTGAPIVDGSARVVPSFDWEYKLARKGRPGQILLQGPHFQTLTGVLLGGSRCSNAYTVSGTTQHAVRLFPSDWSPERVAWHPDDEERWFDSKEACEQVARAAEPVLKREGVQPPGGFHVLCPGEID